jgi:nucleoid DNA-binding protein
MLNSILDSVTKEVGGSLVSKLGLNQEQAKTAIESTGEATMEVVSNQLKGGDISSLMNLFSSKPNNSAANGIQNQITSLIAEKLSGKTGFTKTQIQGVISMVLPVVMNYIGKKNEETPDDDPSPLMDIFGSATKGALGKAAGGFLKDLF